MFSLKESFDQEMKRFSETKRKDPGTANELIKKGEYLVSLANEGRYAKFKEFCVNAKLDQIMFHFIHKSLCLSMIKGHLMISSYIIDNGYPLNNDMIPNILIECLKTLDDSLCVDIILFLSMKKFDFNIQVRLLFIIIC